MSYDPKRYTHDSDRAALKALQAIPGFSALTKGFMNLWNERQYKILNMSSRIRLGEKQMKHYYDMLPPICEKLGIAVPELYVELNVEPNSYTYGDTSPFIVLTSGLFETIPDKLIPTILAHECGHIACRHVLYQTMGRFILGSAATAMAIKVPLGNLLSLPLEIAFYYWMRCSEFSADRAAVLCDGTAEKQQEVCMRFAGWDKDIMAEASMEEFLKQADSYKDMVNTNKWNKTLEFIVMRNLSHPLMALRATECADWAKSEEFDRIIQGLPPLEKKKKKADDDLPDDMQRCKIEDTDISVFLPDDYKQVRSLPEDPPQSVSYVAETEASRTLMIIYPRNKNSAMPFDDPQTVIDGIHNTLADDQGLIEVNSGVTASGRNYIYSIVKTLMKQDGVLQGVQYFLMMDLDYDDRIITVKGFFGEEGTTGIRDNFVFEKLRQDNLVILNEDSVEGWSEDPYDPTYKKGIPMNKSEHRDYDLMFPFHPLSQARRTIQEIIDNN